MSDIIQTQGEVGGGVVDHLQCSHCGHISKSHAEQLSHMAAYHPTCLDAVTVGRLGNILMYQSSARLFHCFECFYTSRDFTKLYQHIITKHCIDKREEAGGEGEKGNVKDDGGKKEVKDAPNRKSSVEEKQSNGPESVRGGDTGEGCEGGDDTGGEGGGDTVHEGCEGGSDAGGEECEEEGDTGVEGGGEGCEGGGDAEGERGGDAGGQGVEEGNVKSEGELEEVKDAPNRKSSEEEQSKPLKSVKVKVKGKKRDLMIDGGSFRCLICGWRNKHKAASVSHMVLKHKIPKCDALQAIKWEAAALTKTPGGMAEDEEGAGLSEEMLKKEIEASAKVISFSSTRYICLICGWKTKIQACITGHVVRSHNVECPYRCTECSQSFFLPSQLQHHIRSFHRPGRYACPFCSFRSEYIGGFRWHCNRCNTQEQGGEDTEGMEGPNEKRLREARRLRNTEMVMIDNTKVEEDEEEEEVRETRKQRSTKMMIRIIKKEDDD